MRKSRLIFGALFTLALVPAWAGSPQIVESQQARFVVEQVADGLGIPWAMAFLSPDKLLVTERGGYINIVSTKTGNVRRLKGAPPVMARGQGGMLDVAMPPDFKTGDWIYFTYVKDKQGQGVTVLARAKLKGDRLIRWRDLLVTNSATNTDRHFGSRIAFDNRGHVYFTVGDRGRRPNAQNLSNHAGTVIRLYRDGRVPRDNPFVNKKDALPEIWSYGHRNPQGIAYDYANKRLWLNEHGPRGGDEINLVLPGRNYGWPVISYGKEYWGPMAVGEGTSRSGMEQPIKQYTPSIAPGSLLLYSGKAFRVWRGNLFSGALKLTHINRVVIDKNANAVAEERLLESMSERIRALAESPQGWIYLSTDSGRILRLRPIMNGSEN
ncbi:MAG: PQQ-dependent sugar dehydrogenase [Acidiferrobacterales bacterium]